MRCRDGSRQRCSVQRCQFLRRTACFVQSAEIRLHCSIFPEDCERFFQELRCTGIQGNHNPVVHPFPFTPSGNDACTTQISEMPGNLGLALPENLDEVADADLSAIHEVQQPKPGAVRQRSKQQRQVVVL